METNFSLYLKSLRVNQGLRQFQMARKIGIEQSYLCALERGHKPPPQKDKLEFLIKKMALNENEAKNLREAAQKSINCIKIPKRIHLETMNMCLLFQEKLPTLSNAQVQMISLTLSMNQAELGAPKM